MARFDSFAETGLTDRLISAQNSENGVNDLLGRVLSCEWRCFFAERRTNDRGQCKWRGHLGGTNLLHFCALPQKRRPNRPTRLGPANPSAGEHPCERVRNDLNLLRVFYRSGGLIFFRNLGLSRLWAKGRLVTLHTDCHGAAVDRGRVTDELAHFRLSLWSLK